MKKRNLKELLKNNFLSLFLVILLICLGAVLAGNVIVKEGAINVDNTLNVSGNGSINGNLGIGTNNPSQKLHVVGNQYIQSGNIGINTAPYNYNAAGDEEIIFTSRSFTDNTTGAVKSGIYNLLHFSPAGSGTITQYILGGEFDVDTIASNTVNNNGYLAGVKGAILHRSNSTLSTLMGNWYQFGTFNGASDSSGTINNCYGIKLEGLKTASSTILNNYGFHVSGVNGTNAYDVYAADSNAKNYFAGKVGIATNSPSYPLQVNGNVSGISIYAQGNISASDYMKHTAVYDKSRGKALDYIKDSSQYLNPDGTINHSAFYGYVTYEHEYCNIDDETGAKTCETKKEDAISISEEEAKLEQAIYELKLENEMLKSELCKKDSSYSWC